MSSPRPSTEDKLKALERELSALEARQETASPSPPPTRTKQSSTLGPKERAFRRLLLRGLFIWAGIVFVLFVLKAVVDGNEMTVWEWLFLPFLLVAVTLLIYGGWLFQIELGKSLLRFFRKKPPET